ncbi:MAG: YoaK family protein [Candidatus Margulisiibacteriota bacterium]
MFKHRIDEAVAPSVYLDWLLLSFLAGSINAGGYLACGRFVSHVTGFATLFGIGMAKHQWVSGLGLLSVPLFFLSGVMLSAFLVDRRFHKNPKNYSLVMALAGFSLLLVTVMGYFNFFVVFGHSGTINEEYVLLILLSFASGLQNAAISTASGATLRTTHLTGMITDLGISVTHVLYPYTAKQSKTKEQRANKLRIGSLLSFCLGSVVAAILFLHIHYLGFLLPTLIAFYAAIKGYLQAKGLSRVGEAG